MTRHQFLGRLIAAVLAPLAPAAWLKAVAAPAQEAIEPLDKPDSAWRKLLPRDAYEVLFEEDTERPHSSALNDEKREGTYVLRGVLPAAVRFRHEVRERDRLAQLLHAHRGTPRHEA